MSGQSRQGVIPQASAPAYGFADRWLADALRLSQQRARSATFSSDQLDAVAAAARQHSLDPEQRMLYRARVLAAQTGLPAAQAAWRQRGRLILVLILLLAFAGGLSAALGVMGSGHAPVNVLWALGALLGINLAMLLFWLVSLGMSPGVLSAGHLWFWLNARFYGRESVLLAQSFDSLNQRAGLTRWWLAAISHGFWSAALAGSLAGLLLALSLRSYAFVWETTILPTPVFTAAVQGLGWLPSLLGFPLPGQATVAAAGQLTTELAVQSDGDRRIWAGWLCGAVLVYGLVPRLMLLVFSGWRVLAGQRSLRLDLHSADWAEIHQQLSPASEMAGVTDPAPASPAHQHSRNADLAVGTAAPLVIGFELDDQMVWPVLPATVERLLAGSREQRQAAITRLEQSPPRALLLVCDSAQTVDRGSLAWLTQASGSVLHVAVWLSGNGPTARRDLWRQQLQTIGLDAARVFDDAQAALRWLEEFV